MYKLATQNKNYHLFFEDPHQQNCAPHFPSLVECKALHFTSGRNLFGKTWIVSQQFGMQLYSCFYVSPVDLYIYICIYINIIYIYIWCPNSTFCRIIARIIALFGKRHFDNIPYICTFLLNIAWYFQKKMLTTYNHQATGGSRGRGGLPLCWGSEWSSEWFSPILDRFRGWCPTGVDGLWKFV